MKSYVLFTLAVLSCSVVKAETEAELIALFKESVIDAADNLDVVELHLKMDQTIRSGVVGKEQTLIRQELDLAIRPGMWLLTRTSEKGLTVGGKNEKYTFFLTPTKVPRIYPKMAPRVTDHTRSHAFPYYIHKTPLAKVVQSEHFTPLSAQRRGRYVEVVFNNNEGVSRMDDAHVVCDTERNWAITEYAFSFKDGRETCTHTLRTISPKVVLIDKSERTMTYEKYKSVRQTTTTLLRITKEAPPKKMFFLTHHGLPEPEDR